MKRKIILFNPPLYFSEGVPHALDVSVPPLGILYLASYTNKHLKDVEVEVIDVAVDGYSLNDLKSIVSKRKPFVVGLTSMTPQLQGTVELAKYLKINFEKIKIFLGGPHISADPEFVNRFSDIFDYAIIGEAEKTFLNSIVKLREDKKIPRIQTGEAILDLDTLPFPDKKLINRAKYSQHESMIFGRGCPYGCYYCSRPSINRKVRYRSADNLIEEIKSVYKYCRGKIDFQDDTFTLNREKVIDFCKEATEENLNLDWRCNTRIDLVDEELLSAMKKAGCSLIHFGIESGNEKIRKEIVNKGQFTNKQIYKVFSWCKKYKIKVAGYFMIGHPEETKKDLEDTREMILNSGIDLLGLSIPTPFPGSRLHEIAKQQGLINEKIVDRFANKELGEGYIGNYPVFTSEKVSRDYIFSLMKEINRKFYINPKMFWRRFKEDACSFSKLREDFWDLISLIFRGMSSRKPYAKQSRGDTMSEVFKN